MALAAAPFARASAQTLPTIQLKATYPFVASRSVAYAAPTESTPPLAFAGFGGGIIALDVSDPTMPVKWDPAGQGGLLRVGDGQRGGFAFDLAVTNQHLYVAGGVAGALRYERSSWVRSAIHLNTSGLEEARAIAVVEVAGLTRVLLVSNNHASTSTTAAALHVIDPSIPYSSGPPATSPTLDSVLVPVPVTCVAAYAPAGSTEIAVLVGTRCGGVKRYSVQAGPLGAYSEIVGNAAVTTWNAVAGAQTYVTYVRDIAIDPDQDVAFVACYGAYSGTTQSAAQVTTAARGVHALRITDAPALVQVGGGWPIDPEPAPTRHYCTSLVYDRDHDRLVVGTGPKLAAETQYSRNCTHEVPCDCDATAINCDDGAGCDVDSAANGVFVYDIGYDDLHPELAPTYVVGDFVKGLEPDDPINTRSIALAFSGGPTIDDYTIYIAGDATGFQSAGHDSSGFDPLVGRFDDENDELLQGMIVPLHAMNSAYYRRELPESEVLYVATEKGVAAFNLLDTYGDEKSDPPPGQVLTPAADEALAVMDGFALPAADEGGIKPGALTLAYLGPQDARVYAADTKRLRIFSVDGVNKAHPTAPEHGFAPADPVTESGARFFHLDAAYGLSPLYAVPPTPPPPLPRWVYASLTTLNAPHGFPSGTNPTSGIAIVDVGTAGAVASDPLTTVSRKWLYRHGSVSANPLVKVAYFGGVTSVPITQQEHVLYVAYGALPGNPVYHEQGAGIAVLRAYLEVVETVPPPEQVLTWVPRIELVGLFPATNDASCDRALPGLVTYEPGVPGVANLSKRLMVGLGCNGFAIYRIPDTPGGMFAPVLEAFVNENSIFNVLPGPLSAAGNPYFYVSNLNQGLTLFELLPAGLVKRAKYATSFQLGQLVFADNRNRIFSPDMRGGISLYELTYP